MTNPITPETIAAALTAAGFAEYRDGQFGFTVTRAAFGGEIIVDLKGIDLLPFNPGEGPRALLNDYRTALDAAGYLVRSTLGLVCVDPDGGVRAPQARRERGVLMFNPDRALGVLIAREEDGRGEVGGDCGCGLGADRCHAAEDGDFGD